MINKEFTFSKGDLMADFEPSYSKSRDMAERSLYDLKNSPGKKKNSLVPVDGEVITSNRRLLNLPDNHLATVPEETSMVF